MQTAQERGLLVRARRSTESQWVLGQCASEWRRQYGRGLGDSAFAELVGMSRRHVNDCRRVYERFGYHPLRDRLTFAHFYLALRFTDPHRMLREAAESGMNASAMAEQSLRDEPQIDSHRPIRSSKYPKTASLAHKCAIYRKELQRLRAIVGPDDQHSIDAILAVGTSPAVIPQKTE